MLKKLIALETQESIELKNGAIIQIRAASFRSVRGPAYIGAVLDELAFFRDNETAANPASEIIAAITPAIIEGGILFGISSVYNRVGILYENFHRHFGRDDSDVLIWKASTLTMNPKFTPAKIARDKAKDLAVALAEYESQWRDDISSLYSSADIEAAIVEGRTALPHAAKVFYHAFVDPSGGRRDSAALAIAHQDRTGRIIIDLALEIRSPHQPGDVVVEFSKSLVEYKLREVVGDRYGGEWPVEAYRKHGITYTLIDKTASDLYLAAMPLFANRQIELPESDRLKNQLLSLLRRTNSGGKDSVLAGQVDGSHADLANAVIGSVFLASQDAFYGEGARVGTYFNSEMINGMKRF